MEESYIAKRITQLRMARNISEYQMSLELGHSKSYIQSITSGKSKPSTQELFNIADYFNMSLSEFFDEENVESPTVQKAIDAIRKLSEQDASLNKSARGVRYAAYPLGLFSLAAPAAGALIGSLLNLVCYILGGGVPRSTVSPEKQCPQYSQIPETSRQRLNVA